jgi:hypothetical protein
MNGEQLKSSQPEAELVTEEEWSSWKGHPITKIFRGLLQKRLKERTEDWISGQFMLEAKNAKAVGEVQVLQAILLLSWEEVNEGMRDE